MHKRFLLMLCFGVIANAIFAQSGEITVQGTSPDLYIMHTVAAKENWYSVGRLYNMSPKIIAPYNAVTLDKPLTIGQQVKVPLTTTNFWQDGDKAEDEVFVPVFHIVEDKEWMYRISTNYNKVSIENLEKWNRISRDEAKAGTKLIVGYLKIKKDQSALVANSTPLPVNSGSTSSTAAAPPASTSPNTTVTEKKTEVVKMDDKQEKQPLPAEEKAGVISKPEKQVAPPAEEKTTVVNKPVVAQPPADMNTNGGYFKVQYEENGKTASGTAGIFKSTSGWQDGKYYALINNVSIGTIVKVSNPSNNKAVYAKVLGQLPDMKESVGLTARLSDAAASELGITASRFSVEVRY